MATRKPAAAAVEETVETVEAVEAVVETVAEEVAAEAPVEAPVAEAAPAKRKAKVVQEAPGFKLYQTTSKHTYPFEIQVKGEVLTGSWAQEDGFVEFAVPDHLVEGFEAHHHFKVGNIVAA